MIILTDEAIVVRGGINRDPDDVVETVRDAVFRGSGAVLSVRADEARDDESFDDQVLRICREGKVRHGSIQLTSAGRLRGAGFSLVHSVDDVVVSNHHHVVWRIPVVTEQAESFVACFDDPVPNPWPKDERIQS